VRAAFAQRDAMRGDDIRDWVPLLDAVEIVDHGARRKFPSAPQRATGLPKNERSVPALNTLVG
jgi:hypothetical protein